MNLATELVYSIVDKEMMDRLDRLIYLAGISYRDVAKHLQEEYPEDMVFWQIRKKVTSYLINMVENNELTDIIRFRIKTFPDMVGCLLMDDSRISEMCGVQQGKLTWQILKDTMETKYNMSESDMQIIKAFFAIYQY